MEQCKTISQDDYLSFLKIMDEYLPGDNEEQIYRMYKKYHSAFVGYYLEDILIGICYGWPRSEVVEDDFSFSLSGIAIIHPHNSQGRGSKLISYFEESVKGMGYNNVSVGSADGYVEKFYMQNGYKPVQYKVLREGKDTYIHPLNSIEDYQQLNKDNIMENVNGYHGFVVFDKII